MKFELCEPQLSILERGPHIVDPPSTHKVGYATLIISVLYPTFEPWDGMGYPMFKQSGTKPGKNKNMLIYGSWSKPWYPW